MVPPKASFRSWLWFLPPLPPVPVERERLEPLDGRAEHGEEAGDDRHDEQAVHHFVLKD